MVLEGVAGIPVFFHFYRIFLQEFLWDRYSCIYPRILQIPGVHCPRPLLAPPGLKVRAAEEAETVMAEEAALMAEALADVALAATIATADATADSKQQSTTGWGQSPVWW